MARIMSRAMSGLPGLCTLAERQVSIASMRLPSRAIASARRDSDQPWAMSRPLILNGGVIHSGVAVQILVRKRPRKMTNAKNSSVAIPNQ